jgi:light-regulated signal transduction histidine kinase (bacteriophytochrome)
MANIQDHLGADIDLRLARSLLDNLLGNAWKFTAKVNPARIEFGTAEKAGSTAFFVRDNGAGFDMAFAGRLFAPFQRLHGAEEFPGTGIGLATAQRIVVRHGGRIWAEGTVNGGATFYFTLAGRASATTS